MPKLTREEKYEKLDYYHENLFFFVAKGTSGEAVLWYGEDGKLATTDISRAGVFTKYEIFDKFLRPNKNNITIWPVRDVIGHTYTAVKLMALNPEKSI